MKNLVIGIVLMVFLFLAGCLESTKEVRYVVEGSLPSNATLEYRDEDEGFVEMQGPTLPWEYEFTGESGQQIYLEVTTSVLTGGTADLEIYIDGELFKSASHNGNGGNSNTFINENIP